MPKDERVNPLLTNTDETDVLPIVDAVGTALFLVDVLPDKTFRYLLLNKEGERSLGFPKGWVKGKRPEDVFDPERANLQIEHYRTCVARKSSHIFEECVEVVGGCAWYTVYLAPIQDEQGEVVRIMGTAIEITAAKKTEQALMTRIHFEQFILSISQRFSQLRTCDIEAGMKETLSDLGHFARVDRVVLSLYSEEQERIYIAYEWCAEGIPEAPEDLKELNVSDFPKLSKQFKLGKVLHIASRHELPPDATKAREILERRGNRAVIFCPMISGGSVIGSLGFNMVREERDWSTQTVALLRMIGDILAHALERMKTEAALRKTGRNMQALAVRLQHVREEESTRMAREIHDQVGQALTAMKYDLFWIQRRISEPQTADREALLERIQEMSDFIDETIVGVRRISYNLRPVILDEAGIFGALEWQAKDFQSHIGTPCNLHLPAEEFPLSPDHATVMFRISQEILTNIARYAKADRVDIGLERQDGHVILTVRDNGIGISRDQINSSKSLGLIGIRERALLLGGTVDIDGVPGEGTTITLKLPINPSAADTNCGDT